MRAVAYGIRPFEKEFLAKANQKKHDITLISNDLNWDTASYAEGKEAVIVSINDDVSEAVIETLAGFGIKFIATRSMRTDHINKAAASKYGIKIANVPGYLLPAEAEHTVVLTDDALQQIANQTIRSLDLWQQGKCTGKACVCADGCKADDLNNKQQLL